VVNNREGKRVSRALKIRDEEIRASSHDNHQSFFSSCDQVLLPDPRTFDDRKQFPIFDPGEEAVLRK
jgi:hypothetical protein